MTTSNLTPAQVLPGFYSYVDFNAAGGGVEPGLRALIWGYASSAAQRPFNQPFFVGSQQDADDGAGRGSELASSCASAASQPEAQGAEIWAMPLQAPSGGVASIYKFKVFVANTNPAKPGTLSLWCKGQKVADVGFDSSDTSATIATNIATAFNANRLDLPVGSVTVTNTDLVNIPYLHKGMNGEDLPFRCSVNPNGSGVSLSAAQALFATSSVGAGSVKVTVGAQTVTTALSGGETAAQVAALVIASWNADSYTFTALVDPNSTATVNFFFRNGYDARRVSAALVTSTGTTVNLGSGATDGTGSVASLSYNGTQGTGAPTLSGALTNLGKLDAFFEWAAPFTDATSVGTLATAIEGASDGSITGQKQQSLTICGALASSVLGALAPACSPNLTTSAPHYAICRAEDAAVQGIDIAARIAAARASKRLFAPQFNWDGFQLKGNDRAPLPLPPTNPTPTAQNSDLKTYAMAPIVKGPSGNYEVVKGRTTSLSTDRRQWAWSTAAQAMYHAVDLPAYLRSLFSGGSTVRNSEPKAAGIFDGGSITKAVQGRMRFWEQGGNYDGADVFAPFVLVTPDSGNPFRFNIKVPESPVLDLDQLAATHSYTSPSA